MRARPLYKCCKNKVVKQHKKYIHIIISYIMNSFKLYYALFLPYILPTTTMVGLYSGFREIEYIERRHNPMDRNSFIKCAMGNYAFGIIAGLTYPVSFPLITAHYMHSSYNKRCKPSE